MAIGARNRANSTQCRHCSQRMNHTAIRAPSRAAVVLPSPGGFSRLVEAWYRNAGATSLSPVAAGNQVLALLPIAFVSYGTNLPDTWPQARVCVGRIFQGRKALRTAGCAAYQVRTEDKSQEGKTQHRGPANAAQPCREVIE